MIKEVILDDGCKFVGNFEEGLRHGFGMKTYPNGATYAGFYECDLRHGVGVKTTAAGEKKGVRYEEGKLIK